MAATGGTEQELRLEVGNLYLLRNTYFYNDSLQEGYVERVTLKAYKLRLQKTDGTWYIEWMNKSFFEQRYVIDEHLGKLTTAPPLQQEMITINDPTHLSNMMDFSEKCPVCDGDGQVPDDRITSGKSTCPKCLGSGRVWK